MQGPLSLVLTLCYHSNTSWEGFHRAARAMADERSDALQEEKLSVCSYCVYQRLGWEAIAKAKGGECRGVCVCD